MSDGNRTVFRPSPLKGLKDAAAAPAPGGFSSPPPGFGAPPPGFAAPPSGFAPPPAGAFAAPPPPSYTPAARTDTSDDVPLPALPVARRNMMLAEAAPILALAASLRSGRAREPLVSFHTQASAAVQRFDRAIAGKVPPETRQRATYALCSTIDDIAQNLPGVGADASEWARRSLVVQVFRENIGGDRFWQIVEELLARPSGQADLIELFHACLAAGFEGRFRVMPDGKRRLHEIMTRLYAALEHPRSLSTRELVPHWKGVSAPTRKVSGLSVALLAGAVALAVLLLAYIGFLLALRASGTATWDALAKLNPPDPLQLARGGGGLPPPPSGQAGRLEQFLAPEIAQGLVKVITDAGTVRVRTTVGQLFKSGSDELEPGKEALFRRIGEAVDKEPGAVTVEGHADSDQPKGLTFPDNMALSSARADKVKTILTGAMADGSRVTAKGMGDTVPIDSNATAAGKTANRRVEVVLQRRD